MTSMFGDFYRGRRVLVTGHTGFKGSWLSHWLLNLGASVAGFSNGIPTQPSNFQILGLEKRLDHDRGDIRNADEIRAAIEKTNPQVIFHLAAQSLVRRSYEEPKMTFETNLGGTVNLLDAVRHSSSVRVVIIITSDKCYENLEWDWGYRETDRLGGKDPYSASKACAELAVQAYVHSFFQHQDAVQIATTRAGNVIGGGDWAADRIVPDCIRAWAAKTSAIIRNPNATRPWQHVLEPLSGYLALAAGLAKGWPGLPAESFNFGPSGENNQSVSELVTKMMGVWQGCDWQEASDSSNRKTESSLLKLNCDKAYRRLKWTSTLTFDETVRMTAEWYKVFYSHGSDISKHSADQINAYQQIAYAKGVAWARDVSRQ